MMYLEVQTGRGRINILILYNQRKYIVETKIWGGDMRYEAGKAQLATYLKLKAAESGTMSCLITEKNRNLAWRQEC